MLSKLPLLRRLLVKIGILPRSYETDWPKLKLIDIRKTLPLAEDSVDFIYCSHVLEHFEKYETVNILKECFRVLKPGGVLRVVLPDLKIMINKFSDAEKFNRDFYGYDKDKKSILNWFIRGHQWMYDEESFLKLIGNEFNKVKKTGFRSGKVPNLRELDLEVHRDHSFYIEAQK